MTHPATAPWVLPQGAIPADQLAATTRPLPGVQPLDPDAWLVRDAAFSDQMAERDRLIAQRPGDVLAAMPMATAALDELETLLTRALAVDYVIDTDQITRPDGVVVPRKQGLQTLGRLVAEDLCVMQKVGDEHVLTAAALCFPASWTLAEKLGRPLIRIHEPIPPYDTQIAPRVQRLFDGIQPGRPLWRANVLPYADPNLFQPRSETGRRDKTTGPFPYQRSERQCLIRLPETRAVVFSIHTVVAWA